MPNLQVTAINLQYQIFQIFSHFINQYNFPKSYEAAECTPLLCFNWMRKYDKVGYFKE